MTNCHIVVPPNFWTMLAACSSSYRREDDPVSAAAASDAVPPHSLSDGCLDPEPHEMNGEKRKRRRRRGKHRFLPYHARTSDDKQLDDANNDNDRRRSLRYAQINKIWEISAWINNLNIRICRFYLKKKPPENFQYFFFEIQNIILAFFKLWFFKLLIHFEISRKKFRI